MRFPNTIARAALGILLLSGVSQAFGQSCGDWITGTVVLTSDLNCTGGGVGLDIGADGTTLALNGHTLSGTASMFGLDVAGRHNVTIKGPGRIVGFGIGVRAGAGSNLRVENVRFESVDLAITENHGQSLKVVDNDFIDIGGIAVSLRTTVPGSGPSKGGLIEGNWFDGGETAIELCGMNTHGHIVRHNRITNQSVVAIRLRDEAHHNQLFANNVDFSKVALGLYNARDNVIKSDRYTDGVTGVWLSSQSSGPCVTTGASDVVFNTFDGMSLYDLHTAARFGGTGHGGLVKKNFLLGSKIYDNQRGVVMESDSYGNAAVDNALFGTVQPIIDNGVDNETAPNYCDPPGC